MSKALKINQPSLVQSLLEGRALLEVAALQSSKRWLQGAPKGDGHPVLVLPGFMTGDGSTNALRRYLGSLGYNAYPWELGRNPGLRQDVLTALESKLKQLSERHNCKVSIVGWSLGGLYARALSRLHNTHVRQVITLGSPFNIPQDGHISSSIGRLYEWFNPADKRDALLAREELWRKSPPVPSTAIYTEGDGVAPWQYGVDPVDAQTENLRVRGSHAGLTHNPVALYAIADRLALSDDQWLPFEVNWRNRLFYRKTCGSRHGAAFA